MGKKILWAIIAVVIGLLLVAGIIFFLTMKKASDNMAGSNRILSETIREQSSAYLTGESQLRMMELAENKAEIADALFFEFERGVCTAASVAEQIYSHPEEYAARSVPLPAPERDGELTIQVLYSAQTDPEDPAIREELGLIGNVQDVLMSVNASQENMASIYVATESGFMVQADFIPAKKFDESGNLMPMEAKERPWYEGAARAGKPFFTPVTKDAHTPRLAIMCGVPVYCEEQLMGVAGAGMYLDDLEDLIKSVDLGEGSNACILSRRGQVLFSTYEEGTLAAVTDAPDLRLSEDEALAEMTRNAVAGKPGVSMLALDGVPSYAAFAPMKSVGWSMIVFLSQETVEAPTNRLLVNINEMTERSLQESNRYIRNANVLLLILLGLSVYIALIVSVALSNHIVKPIRQLTGKVGAMQGDNLDFTWETDTGDETQLLATSFQSLTQRMKEYIRENEVITAERERISTELSLATRIQASMLPSIFPPFPERAEFDLYALMDPAREVGGDFYDFFLVDEDHLCMVIADVSGKGIPAALFMMASKIIIQSYAMMGRQPGEILTRTNETICSNNQEEMFVTAWVGILELSTGRLTAANAGHEYPAVKKPDGEFALVKDKHGFVIGGMSGVAYKEYELKLEPGSKVFVYTDGVPEAMGGNGAREMFGTERMLAALNGEPEAPPKQIIARVRGALENFVKDAEQFDDITMLCIEYRGRTEPED